jgi:hypothetical protein
VISQSRLACAAARLNAGDMTKKGMLAFHSDTAVARATRTITSRKPRASTAVRSQAWAKVSTSLSWVSCYMLGF